MKVLNKFFQNKYAWIVIYSIAIGIPFLIAFKNIVQGAIPFWYDPARDFIQALESFHKPTLHGPPSGIPGIFYGPQWIWLISFGLLFSHDPRVVVFIIQTIPYLLIAPLLLLSMASLAPKKVLIVMWVFFALNFAQVYATFPWNPHMAAFLFFLLIFLTLKINEQKFVRRDFILMGLCGFIAGTILNVHISFGIGLTVGTIIYLLIDAILSVRRNKKLLRERFILLLCFAAGFATTLVPYFLFEIRHGFNQTQTLIATLTAGKSVVTVTGLTRDEIVSGFFNPILTLFKIPLSVFIGLAILAVAEIAFSWKKKKLALTTAERKVGLLIICITLSILTIYLLTKNPVWSYHFIALEVLFLFGSILVLKRTKIAFILVALWSIVVLVMHTVTFIESFSYNPLNLPNLISKEYIVDLIEKDAGDTPYGLFAYSPSIYIYEYAYLFSERTNKEVSFDPGSNRSYDKIVYLIIPEGEPGAIADFINFRTPEKDYGTIKSWSILDGTKILKRQLLNDKL